MKNKNIKITISVISFIGILAHIIFPDIAIDFTSISLLLIGISPWLSSILKSLKFGDLTIEYRDLEKIEERLDKANLIKTIEEKDLFIPEKLEDPIMSLAWLRIEIEKKIKDLNSLCNFQKSRNFHKMLQQLKDKEIIDFKEFSALKDLRGILNKAIHGETIDPRASKWAFTVGSEILSALDTRIKIYEESCNL